MNSSKHINLGVITVNNALHLANFNNKSADEVSFFPSSIQLAGHSQSKSKVFKKHAIHLIRFCLKTGITENAKIIQFLKQNEVVLKGRTFDRYKMFAEKELENDLDTDIWLSEKVQNGLVQDYKDISDRYDQQLIMDDMLTECLVRQAIDKAIQYDNDPEKYYKHLDMNEMMKIQAVSNYTIKNKLELISKGFMIYKIKQHIDSLREQLNQKELTREDIDICSKLSFLQKSNPNPALGTNDSHQLNNELPNEEYSQEYLDENNLVIGMNGRPIKKYLADIEKKLGKPLSTL